MVDLVPCHLVCGKFNKIFEKSLVILTLVTYSSVFLGFTLSSIDLQIIRIVNIFELNIGS